MLQAGLFFFISQSKPLDKLSPERPHATIFTPYFFLSLMGQFALNLSFLVIMYNMALAAMPPDERQQPDGPFKPNLVNTVCYIVNSVVQLSTFASNYVGAPHNTPLRENGGLYSGA